jgi:hypothetical protein
MNIQRIHFLREILVTDRKGIATVVIEFSYDDRFVRRPRFFCVPDGAEGQARQLYLEWGGSRPLGYRIGTTVSRPESLARIE